MIFRYLFLTLFSLALNAPSFADIPKENKVSKIYASKPVLIENISHDLLITLTNGDIITLPNIYIPNEMTDKAYQITKELLHKQHPIFIEYTTQKDRYNHIKSDIKTPDNKELQKILLQNGLALFMPSADDNSLILLEYEETAKTEHKGVWSKKEPYIKNIGNISNFIGEYQIVTGKILSTYKSKKHIYLNFGTDWKTDFTVSIPLKSKKYFHARGMYPLSWKNKNIQIRGWVEYYNGAMIKAFIPSQIKLIPTP